ncbi:hypothetical protein [Natrialba sp. INN-245]|uniref:hypothetical protein n=1 Tax=Natrialba sp. INN-245 TaxID=2690967 RepID=UPI0013110ECC|nr:hypothetical protein [Natrialba sp. INN-245]MWV39221.1 hypothetical protein [Natrialba sp. INN-245]
MNGSWTVTLGAIAVSLLLIPGGLTYFFANGGLAAVDGSSTVVIGLIAMLPGVLMGSTALWVAAQG